MFEQESTIYPLIPISLSEPLADSRARKRAVVGVYGVVVIGQHTNRHGEAL